MYFCVHARMLKFLSEGVQLDFDNVFLLFVLVKLMMGERREDPNTTKS